MTTKPVWNKKEKWAPFITEHHLNDATGLIPNSLLLVYNSWYPGVGRMEWREVSKPFEATLQYGGRSYVGCIWKDPVSQATYPMFPTEFCDGFSKGLLVGNKPIRGLWKVVKKNTNYGIALVELL